MASIVTRNRFTDSQLAHAIDCYLLRGEKPPSRLSDIIRQLFETGIIALRGSSYTNNEPSLSAVQHLRNITRQTVSNDGSYNNPLINTIVNKQLMMNQKQPQTQLHSQSQTNIVNDFSAPNIHAHLVEYLDDEDKTAGANMLANIATGGVTIIENLQSDNERISKITYEMFRHADSLTEDEIEAINAYEKKN